MVELERALRENSICREPLFSGLHNPEEVPTLSRSHAHMLFELVISLAFCSDRCILLFNIPWNMRPEAVRASVWHMLSSLIAQHAKGTAHALRYSVAKPELCTPQHLTTCVPLSAA